MIKLSVEIGNRKVEYRVNSPDELDRALSEIKALVGEGVKRKCTRNSWYIRVRPEILLEILIEAYSSYKSGALRVSDVVERWLQERGYNKSLARVITPTVSALGLSEEGLFNRRAVEYGRALANGGTPKILADALEENCIINEIMSEARKGCRSLDEVVVKVFESYGKSIRKDEVVYTSQLIRLIHGDPCESACNKVIDVLKGREECIGRVEEDCRDREEFVRSLLDYCRGVLFELFEKLDVGVRIDSLNYRLVQNGIYVATTKNLSLIHI